MLHLLHGAAIEYALMKYPIRLLGALALVNVGKLAVSPYYIAIDNSEIHFLIDADAYGQQFRVVSCANQIQAATVYTEKIGRLIYGQTAEVRSIQQ